MKLMEALLFAASLPLSAQWLNHPDARIPRTHDGKPNLGAPAPRLNGKPDLSGYGKSSHRLPPNRSGFSANLRTALWRPTFSLYPSTR